MRFALFITGYKGFRFLEKLEKYKPDIVITYNNREGSNSVYYDKIIDWCNHNDINVVNKKKINQVNFDNIDKIFAIGWQFIIKNNLDKLVVFHDSYLPEKRGFAPTVSSLLNKDEYLGATAFWPYPNSSDPDFGLVYSRKKVNIKKYTSLKEAFDIVVNLYCQIFNEIIEKDIKPEEIDYSKSTFSMWRDSGDAKIDWNCSAEDIKVKVLSLGYPYEICFAVYEDKNIIITDVDIVEDVDLILRQDHIGKIYKLDNGKPIVICGSGLLKIIVAKAEDGKEVGFDRLRRRFS